MAEAEVDKLQVIVASLMELAKEKLRDMKKKDEESVNIMNGNFLTNEGEEQRLGAETNLLKVPSNQLFAQEKRVNREPIHQSRTTPRPKAKTQEEESVQIKEDNYLNYDKREEKQSTETNFLQDFAM